MRVTPPADRHISPAGISVRRMIWRHARTTGTATIEFLELMILDSMPRVGRRSLHGYSAKITSLFIVEHHREHLTLQRLHLNSWR
eukprot:COSAG02_NODE_157_length_32999_cov_31.863647_22_plen_85_part_00